MFWERFYTLCVSKGTKPNPLAKEIGISSGAITKWKTENTLPSGETLLKLADYLNCSVDYLLGRTEALKTINTHEESLVDAYKNQPEVQLEVDRILGLAPQEESVLVYRAAQRDDREPGRVMEIPLSRLKKLQDAHPVLSDEDI